MPALLLAAVCGLLRPSVPTCDPDRPLFGTPSEHRPAADPPAGVGVASKTEDAVRHPAGAETAGNALPRWENRGVEEKTKSAGKNIEKPGETDIPVARRQGGHFLCVTALTALTTLPVSWGFATGKDATSL